MRTIGYYMIIDEEAYRWHWMGRSPKVRKALEMYFERNEPGKWNTTYNETQSYIAKEVGVSRVAMGNNLKVLLREGIILQTPLRTAEVK